MKILALNSSPRREKSNTNRLLLPFLEGAREAGAEVDIEYLHGKKINPCLGCFHCWLKKPGVCVQKDDQAELLEKVRHSDVIVYATPLYLFGISAQMKLFLDRIIPIALPFIEAQDGHCTHPRREGNKLSGMVVISNCGFHELDNFDDMLAQFKTIARHSKIKFLGALLRPEGEFLEFGEKMMPEAVQSVYDAAREAGAQVAAQGMISDEVQKAVSRQLLPFETFLKAANAYFQQQVDHNKSREADTKN